MAQDNSDLGLEPVDSPSDNSDLGLEPIGAIPTTSNPLTVSPYTSHVSSILKHVVRSGINTAQGISQGLRNLGSTAVGAGHELYNNPEKSLSGLAQGGGGGFYNIPENVANAFGKDIHNKYYPNIVSPEAGTNSYALGNFAGSLFPIGRAAKLGELGVEQAAKYLPQFAGKNFLTKGTGLAAGGALSAPTVGQNPISGAETNTLLGGLGNSIGALAGRANKLAQAYGTVAPVLTNDLNKIPKLTYQDAAKNYVGLGDQAGTIFDRMDNSPDYRKEIPNNATAFPDAIQNQLDELSDQGKGPEITNQRDWLNSFVDKSLNINNFKDIHDLDKQLNKLYSNKTYNLNNNPGLKYQYSVLKNALNEHLDQMGDAVPDSMKQDLQDAKSLWKQRAAFETLPESNEASDWWKQARKEKNLSNVAQGKGGNAGNFLNNALPSSENVATTDKSANLNHLLSITSPEMKPYIGSAYLNPKAQSDIPIKDLAKKYNSLNDESKNALFGTNTPTSNALQMIATTPHIGALGRWGEKLAGLAIGAELHHPLMGLAAGAIAPNLFNRSTVRSPGTANALQNLRMNLPTTATRRQNVYLPAALAAQPNTQNK